MAETRREPIPVPVETKIILELSEEEASTLLQVLNSIGGDPRTTRRGLMDNIGHELERAGVSPAGGVLPDPNCTGVIWFHG